MKNTQKGGVNIKKDEKSAKSIGKSEKTSSLSKKSDEKIEKEIKIVNFNKDDINKDPIERADIFLFLEFFENYNENNLEKCQEILTIIMKAEPNNTKVKEMHKMLKEALDIESVESENETEEEAHDNLSSNKNMKINELGEYYYSDAEEESEEDEDK